MTALLSLPTELLLSIFDLLPPPSKHIFSLSCRYLNYTFAPLCPSLDINEIYVLRSALARDGISFTNHAYCAGCHTVHRHKYFNTDELPTSPVIRKCTTTQKSLYIEPGKFLSYQDATNRDYWLPRPYSSNSKPPRLNSGSIIRFGREKVVNDREFAVCASYELLSLPDIDFDSTPNEKGSGFDFRVSRAEIARILRGFDIPTCPHTRLGDDLVVKSYCESVSRSRTGNNMPSTEELRQEYRRKMGQEQVDDATMNYILSIWNDDKANACCQFPGCKTTFRWECRSSLRKDGWKTILLHVKRYLGHLLAPSDLHWMAQLVTVPDEDRLKKYWAECFEWRDVNSAVEEIRYEQLLLARDRSGKMELGRAEEVEFELLRRENDYMRHPHRKRHMRSVLGELGVGETSHTRLSPLEPRYRQAEEEELEEDLYRPLHSAESLEILEKDDFKKKFNRMRGFGSYQKMWIENLFRSACNG
ncbi:hypothetical protein BDW60DRAFT_26269 [Aspergillus nidulans var. acristatus]